jgi:hypothetical protein
MTYRTRRRRVGGAAVPLSAVVLAGALAGCVDSASGGSAAFVGGCPDRMVCPLSWFPGPTHPAFLTPLLDRRYAVGHYLVDDMVLTVTGNGSARRGPRARWANSAGRVAGEAVAVPARPLR